MVFQEGPVFSQILLADEINRATPKTQSAMLEAMQERQVTIGGKRRALPQPFFVMATQNPLEMEGTYPLPEAQLDRFFYKIQVPFPTLDELVEVMNRTTGNQKQAASSVLTPDELLRMRTIVRQVQVAPEVLRYAMRLVLGSHPESDHGTASAKQYIRYGASPRGAQALILGGRVNALMDARYHVAIRDIRKAAQPGLRHRIGLNFEAESDGLGPTMLSACYLTRCLKWVLRWHVRWVRREAARPRLSKATARYSCVRVGVQLGCVSVNGNRFVGGKVKSSLTIDPT